MNAPLVVFEDSGWRSLRPLTDLVPVPALAFGVSTMAERLGCAFGTRVASIEARAPAMTACRTLPRLVRDPAPTAGVAVNGAALPGPWVKQLADESKPALFTTGARLVAARLTDEQLAQGAARGADYEGYLRSLRLPERAIETRLLEHPWQIVEWNAEAIASDLESRSATIQGEVHATAVRLAPDLISIEPGARVDPLAVLDARSGPILIREGASVASHTLVVGPCVIGRGTQLLGGMVGRSTIGPECRIAGEVEESVWQGYGNKRHHGFVGHSVVGEWVNLGALTTTSDLKNNYGNVRVWVDGQEIDSGSPKVGSFIGAHVKTGIGSLLPTGASVGTGANVFGGGRFAPKRVPSFGWWDGERMIEHRLEAFLGTARIAMSRRSQRLTAADEQALSKLFQVTAAERAA